MLFHCHDYSFYDIHFYNNSYSRPLHFYNTSYPQPLTSRPHPPYQDPNEETLCTLHDQLRSRHLLEQLNQLTVNHVIHASHLTSRLNIDACRKLLDKIQRMTAVLNERRCHLSCMNKMNRGKVKSYLNGLRNTGQKEMIRDRNRHLRKSKRRSQKFYDSIIPQVFTSLIHRSLNFKFSSLKLHVLLSWATLCRAHFRFKANGAQPIRFLVCRNIEKHNIIH